MKVAWYGDHDLGRGLTLIYNYHMSGSPHPKHCILLVSVCFGGCFTRFSSMRSINAESCGIKAVCVQMVGSYYFVHRSVSFPQTMVTVSVGQM